MDYMHVKFPETIALLLQLVIGATIDAIITPKNSLNEAFTTQNPCWNLSDHISKSNNATALRFLLDVAHARAFRTCHSQTIDSREF